VVTGEMEKFFPMDILPMYLIKAILVKDIDQMENLGIYEVGPEDFALAEFANTSKENLQKIVREGLEYLRKEMN
jgi:Na+-transporting NADH:ubiquinone oxidoreductase subunit A